ncbi:MAG TPA: hypothetical protein VE956_22900 [Nodularia sp. (in: cyanobacteria)]|nr:hypothetical protein [Nodularia sp. (in: cyanobacteria)]
MSKITEIKKHFPPCPQSPGLAQSNSDANGEAQSLVTEARQSAIPNPEIKKFCLLSAHQMAANQFNFSKISVINDFFNTTIATII